MWVVGRINVRVTALTWKFYKKMYGRFAGPRKSDRITEVAVRWGPAVISHSSLYGVAKTRGSKTTAKLIQNPSK